MKKEQLEKEFYILDGKLEAMKEKERETREHISGFLGSFKTNPYDREPSIKVLSWEEIYFKLGKIMERSQTFKQLEKMIEGHEHLQRSVNELQERVYAEDDRRK